MILTHPPAPSLYSKGRGEGGKVQEKIGEREINKLI
jgi:hypothetical protein